MNRNRFRLVFSTAAGMMVPAAETARSRSKTGRAKATCGAALALTGVLLGGNAQAELPVASAQFAAPGTTAAYQFNAMQAYINQVGNKAIVNFDKFNISEGYDVRFQQVDSLAAANLVPGASFSVLGRIHDINPSIIAGSISQGAGQKANLILVNSNGIAFMGGSQVNLNQFTASTLNIQDDFIGNLLQGGVAAQFEKALDGGAARGFIKVMEGARISAGNSGRVMLIAPTVVNKGSVTAPDGQIIIAAASKAYLRASDDNNVRGLLIEVDSPSGLNSFDTANADVKDGVIDGQAVKLTNAAEDKLGHATNLGELSTPRGNITMVGYAVNQKNIARATTSVVANGSIYLLAQDTVYLPGTQNTSSQRTGQVTLGAGSVTEILPETHDATTTQDGKLASGAANPGLDSPSRVLVVGRDVRVEGEKVDSSGTRTAGAQVLAPSGSVSVYAVEAGASTTVRSLVKEGGLLRADIPVSSTTRVHVGKGARFDVAGLTDVPVSVTRNVQEVELRGDELKDSPINRDSPIRNEKVHVDVERALTRAESGQSTLISKDRLEALRAQEQRTVAERSTAGGTVEILSQGEAIIEPGVQFDVSGGNLAYTPGQVKTTILTNNGKPVDIADADAESRYDGIATRFVIDYGRWNRKEIIDLGQSYRYDAGYTEGKDAGVVAVFGMNGTVMQGGVAGRTVTGERQREAGIAPRGARLIVGYDDVSAADLNKSGTGYQDYKLNQRVRIATNGDLLPAGFRFGDALPEFLKSMLTLDPELVGKDKVAELSVYSNQAVELRAALAMPANGAVTIAAPEVTVGADITAGAINLAARYTLGQTLPTTPTLTIADGVTLSTRGEWVNDQPRMGANSSTPRIDGGVLALNAESIANGADSYIAQGEIVFGEKVLLNADSGGWLKANGKFTGGKGGKISVQGFTVDGWENVDAHAYGMGKGGAITLGAGRIQVGGAPLAAGAIDLDSGFFARGGFADYSLKALTNLTVAANTHIRASLQNRDLAPGDQLRASGTPVAELGQLVVRDDRVRQAVNLDLSASLKAAESGDLVIGRSARIESDPKAAITLQAYRLLDVEGSIATAGGVIKASADSSFGTVWLGDAARLDVGGNALTYADNRGLTQGKVLAGGQVSLSASNVVSKTGSVVDIAGAAPVHLDVLNESGDLGRTVGSDAGTLTVLAYNKALLDGGVEAHGGSANQRGGVLDVTLGIFEEPAPGTPLRPSMLKLAQSVPAQTTGLQPGDSLAATQTILAADKIEVAGFDRVRLSSRDAIRLENGLDLGASRSLPLREVTLDAASIQTAGGDAAIAAETVRLGNYHPGRRAASTAATNTGTLTVDARQLELAGKLALEGMARAELKGAEEIRLAGVSVSGARPAGELNATADLLIHGALVAPTSYSQYSINAAGHAVAFTRNTDTPVQPWSALGSLTVRAADIVQDGNLWAPFGNIDLQASHALTFKDGSLTSAAAAPGSLTLFGKVENGRQWVFDTDASNVDKLKVADLDGKAIRTSGATIDMQPGAKIDLSGGGDIQAYEFTPGPGGSRDILTDANTYAIVPGYTGGYAMADAQDDQSHQPGLSTTNKVVFNRAPGDAVYLTGVPGLKNGVYTLLPAHYALLPGAYAVKLDSSGKEILPHQAYGRQDGVHVAAGYVTDTRAGAPKDARWQGIQVLTHEQVRARSEFTLTRASEFFADSRNRPQDAGLLSINTTGSGADALKLDAVYKLAAGADGRGGQVDISALKLAVTSGTPAGLDPDAVVLDADRLNALGAESLLIGGTRTTSADTTTLTVGAETLTLANDAAHTLKAAEILLAAKDTLTLKAGSAIDAQGEAGDAGAYETAGNGAFVRAASTSAGFSRTGSPDRTKGTLIGEPGSQIIAADSITLDATRKNDYRGTTIFSKNGVAVAGNLAVGAERVNFGGASADGITYSQAELNAFSSLKSLTLSSYTTFDLYGGVQVGGIVNGKPTLQNLTLQGAGLAGIDNAGQTAQLNAQNLTLANPQASTFTPGGALGSGTLAVTADTLTLGKGDKAIQGFGAVGITANELVGSGTGKLDAAAPVTLNVARISGERGADQAFNSSGVFKVAQHTADRVLAPVTALGAKWALQGTSVDFDSHVELPSGTFKLTATTGEVKLGAKADVDVAGRSVAFFDVTKPSWGGTAEFVSDAGNVNFNAGAKVDVSAAAGGDAGTLIVSAANGKFIADGGINGAASVDGNGQRGEGARALIDVKELSSFSTLNTALNSGGFDGERDVRVRTGNVSIAASDTAKALNIRIAADGGTLDVAGKLDASGKDAGRIELFAKSDVNIFGTATLDAVSSGAKEDGGDIEIGSRDGFINLPVSNPGKGFNVAGGMGGQGGSVLLRTQRTASTVNIGSLASSGLDSARSVSVEAVKVYNPGDIGALSAGSVTLTAADLGTINASNTTFAANHATIKTTLGAAAAQPNFHILSGVEIRSAGDLTLTQDWNLKDSRAGGEAGVLTLRANGNLKLNSNLSDGFSHATACTTATCAATPAPASLLAGDSWTYRLIGGADGASANPLATVRAATVNTGNVEVAAGKLVRTGTGDIRVAAGGNIELKDNKAVIYTAGRVADPVSGFVTPNAVLRPVFSQQGGDVALRAQGDILGKATAQLYSQWLYRQGAINAATGLFDKQPAWWVRFDQFQQGIGALGGGDVSVIASGAVKDLSANAPTQGRTRSAAPDASALVVTGGGDVRVEAGSDVLGGTYYTGRGELLVQAGGDIGASGASKPLVALGDAQAQLRAGGDVTLGNAISPQLLEQAAGNLRVTFTLPQPVRSLFSTYSADSAIALESLSGKTTMGQDTTRVHNRTSDQPLLPSNLAMISFQGDIEVGEAGISTPLTMNPSANGGIELLAQGGVLFNNSLTLSDMDPARVPNAVRPTNVISAIDDPTITKFIISPLTPKSAPNAHASNPLHANDAVPVRVYALNGEVAGINSASLSVATVLNVPKHLELKAGGDVRDITLHIQHTSAQDVSRVEAGRSVVFGTTFDRRDHVQIRIGGPGRLEVTAGKDIDLGTSGGIVSRGNLDNAALPSDGASIRLAAGVGATGIDYAGTVDRVLAQLQTGSPDDTTLWLARWLAGDDTLTAGNALLAVQALNKQDAATQKIRVEAMLYTALRTTGRDSLKEDSPYAADYARGYAALATLFPGIDDQNADGSSKQYKGDINLFASRVKTDQGGNIDFMAPGGNVIVGLANTAESLTQTGNNVLGMVVSAQGDIRGFARDDILVNQSRILTVGGGDVLLWSSEGDIDAGKGKKSASSVPPPIVKIDPATGLATLELLGAVSGSGIGALESPGVTAGDVDLIAPKGTVNAGDAGIRAGNLSIAAQVVLGADNITVSGTSSGTPVADTSAVSAASSGASNADGGVSNATAALSQGLSEAARSAEELKKFFKPTFISAEVIGHGE